jgi:hypothetical protein
MIHLFDEGSSFPFSVLIEYDETTTGGAYDPQE